MCFFHGNYYSLTCTKKAKTGYNVSGSTMHHRIQSIFFFTLFLGAVALAFFILRPYLSPLFLAFVLYIVWKPVHHKIEHRFGKYKTLAAGASLLVLLLTVFVPLTIFGIFLYQDATNLYTDVTAMDFSESWISRTIESTGVPGKNFLENFGVDLVSIGSKGLQAVLSNAGSILSSIFSFSLSVFVMIVALFYLLRDGERLRNTVMLISPLPNTYDADVYDKVEHSIAAVVKGSLLIALAQGVAASIGFLIFGIPNAMLWGAVSAVTSIIPNVGVALVLVPMVVYLYIAGSTGTAIGLTIWGIVVVGLIDNVLRLFVVKTGVPIHPFIILLSVIGGVGFFGGIGVIAGPVVMSFVYAIFHLYPRFVSGNNPL